MASSLSEPSQDRISRLCGRDQYLWVEGPWRCENGFRSRCVGSDTRRDWHFKEALTRPGYDLAIGTDVVPSLHVYTSAEWEQLRAHASVFRDVVERDRVPVS
jgi:hypothetical protein